MGNQRHMELLHAKTESNYYSWSYRFRKVGSWSLFSKKMGSSIISGDAFQVYQGMDIGTAKVSRSEMEGVPHYLVDCFHPTESYSAAIFAEKASHYIEIENNSGRIPFIVGGTGLYIEGLLAGFEFRDKGSTRQHWMDLYENSTRQTTTYS